MSHSGPIELPLATEEITVALRKGGAVSKNAALQYVPHQSAFRRHATLRRWHCRVDEDRQPLFHLVLGPGLSDLYERARAFAEACPTLACRPLFHLRHTSGIELLGIEHFAGESLDHLVRTGRCDGTRWLGLVRQAQKILDQTSEDSPAEQRSAELERLVLGLQRRADLLPLDFAIITDHVQPAILERVAREPCRRRWSNGDFAGRNLLVDSQDQLRLIDYESASPTHFATDDWCRLIEFSTLPATLPDAPEIEAAQQPHRQAYCWLRQIAELHSAEASPSLAEHIELAVSQLLIAASWSASASTGSALLRLAAHQQRRTELLLKQRTEWARSLDTELGSLREKYERQQKEWQERGRWGQRLDAELTDTRREVHRLTLHTNSLEKRADQDRQYFRAALAMQKPTLSNVCKNVRHRLNLIADWSFGSWMPRLRQHRLRHVVWQIANVTQEEEAPSDGSSRLLVEIRDLDGRAPSTVFATLGLRKIEANQSSSTPDGDHAFIFRLPAGRDLKLIRLYATLDHGTTIPLGYRLLRCSKEGEHEHSPPDVRASTVDSVPSVVSPVSSPIELPAATSPGVSIIIPVYNQTNYTLQCLRAIARNTEIASFEVIVIDDCSTEADISLLRDIANLKVYRNPENSGFIKSCNRGAMLASGKYILFLNNDTEVQKGWLAALMDVVSTRSDAGLIGAKLVYPDGTLQEAGGICWRDGSAWNYGRDRDPTYPEFNYLRETDYCSGACLLLPMDLWRELGGFDERYVPAYYEDTDLAFRVRAAGRKVYYQPKAVVVHHEGRSNGTDTAGGVKAYQVRNQQVFCERWKDTLGHHQPNGERVFRARERSFGRKIILVIDHYVPWPDKDAGSRNMMAYLRFFLESGYVVKFIGDNHAAHQPYTDQLERLGIEVLVGPHFKDHWPEWLAVNGPEIDYVFLSRAHTAKRWLEPLRQHTKAPLLFYGHDLLSRTLRRAYEQFGDAAQLDASEEIHALEREVFAAVDWIFYPSAEEVAALRAEFPRYQIGRLPLYTFGEPDRAVPGFAERRGLLFVGGFGHPPNADAMLWFVREALPELRRLCPGIHLTIVGSHPSPEILALAADDVVLRSNVPETELVELYRTHRLAIAPLRMGGGIKGKILEAMFLGTPVVTTPIGAEGLSWTEPHLVTTPETEFARAVAALHDDPVRWQELQANAWRFLAEEYSTECLREALAPALMSTAASPA
jgi:GT2 family glycosyltransferase